MSHTSAFRSVRKHALAGLIALALALVALAPAAPAAHAQSTCGDSPTPRLVPGATARVAPGSGLGNNLRSSASAQATTLGVMPEGEIVTVLSGPTCAEDLNWWQVRRVNGQTGYTVEGDAGAYWMEPWPVAGGALNAVPAPEPDSGRIAYVRRANLTGELVVAAADGSNPVRLSPAGMDVHGFAWSPLGDRLAYYDATNLYVVDANGENALALTGSTEAINNQPGWAPDGTRLAFVSDRGGNSDLYAINVDGSGLVNLTNSPTVTDADPAWSPDGTQIAFTAYLDGGVANIYLMASSGGTPTNLTNTSDLSTEPAWSPDGTQIAYYATTEDGLTIMLAAVDGSAATELAQIPDRQNPPAAPVFSPDGTRIAYTTIGPAEESAEGGELYSVRTDGTDPIQYTADGRSAFSPSWSPDGEWIAFASTRIGPADIWAVRASGAGIVQLTDGGIYYSPEWAPDPDAIGPVSGAAPGEEDLLLIYDGSVPVFTLQNTSGQELDLRPLAFQSAERTVPATIWDTQFLASPLERFKSVGCLMIWSFGVPEQPAPPECGDARQGWVSETDFVFWTSGDFNVLYNNQVLATCPGGTGRCLIDLP